MNTVKICLSHRKNGFVVSFLWDGTVVFDLLPLLCVIQLKSLLWCISFTYEVSRPMCLVRAQGANAIKHYVFQCPFASYSFTTQLGTFI